MKRGRKHTTRPERGLLVALGDLSPLFAARALKCRQDLEPERDSLIGGHSRGVFVRPNVLTRRG